jgi:hypothetical protein
LDLVLYLVLEQYLALALYLVQVVCLDQAAYLALA